jgi:hypothetical protein
MARLRDHRTAATVEPRAVRVRTNPMTRNGRKASADSVGEIGKQPSQKSWG